MGEVGLERAAFAAEAERAVEFLLDRLEHVVKVGLIARLAAVQPERDVAWRHACRRQGRKHGERPHEMVGHEDERRASRREADERRVRAQWGSHANGGQQREQQHSHVAACT